MKRRTWRWLVPLTVATVLLAVGLAHFASSKPDGLERVAEQQGFAKKEQVTASSPMPDYELKAFGGPVGRTVAGLAGIALTFGMVLGLGWLIRRRRRPAATPADPKNQNPGPEPSA